MSERPHDAEPEPALPAAPAPTPDLPPGRAARGPDEGPAIDGGSALAADDEAAEEEIGGG